MNGVTGPVTHEVRYRHAAAVAPEDLAGSAVALLDSRGAHGPVLAVPCPPGEVLETLEAQRVAIRRQLAAGEPVVVLTNVRQDQITARDQLAKLVPDGWTVRV